MGKYIDASEVDEYMKRGALVYGAAVDDGELTRVEDWTVKTFIQAIYDFKDEYLFYAYFKEEDIK